MQLKTLQQKNKISKDKIIKTKQKIKQLWHWMFRH